MDPEGPYEKWPAGIKSDHEGWKSGPARMNVAFSTSGLNFQATTRGPVP